MNIWITGANGFLGKAVQKACREAGIAFIATSKNEVDISSFHQVSKFVDNHQRSPFTHIINCAALAHVDLAEKYPATAYEVNVLGPENLGKISHNLNIPILHFSTEYIFNGCASAVVFKEEDIPYPVGVYAITKREGEIRLLATSPSACIIRTSWLFGGEGKTFLSSLFDRIKQERTLKIDAYQKGRATYVEDLVSAIFSFFDRKGIFHFANQEETSRYDIAVAMKEEALASGISIACVELLPMPSDSFSQINKRPISCILDTSKVETIQGFPIRSWKEAVKELVFHFSPHYI